MFPSALRNSGAGSGGSSSGGTVQHAVEADHATTADTASAANSVPWTGITSKPTNFTPPLATNGTRGGIQIGYSENGRNYPVKLSGEQAYVNVPWTDHYAWTDITGKPSAYPPESHSHSWGSITSKPANKTAWGQTYVNGSSEFQNISGAMSDVSSIDSLIYFDTANSRVGIGTNNPSTKFSVAGSIYASGGFTFLSDIRKKNVIDYDQKLTVEDIANAPLIHYTLKDDKEQRVQVGSVAQYWEKKLPETVLKDEEGTLSMQYDVQAHTAAVVLARKVLEMQKEIDELKKKLNGK